MAKKQNSLWAKVIRRLLSIAAAFILVVALIIGCIYWLTTPSPAARKAAYADTYTIGKMEYPSLVKALGEKRKVLFTGINDPARHSFSYWSRSNKKDVARYADYLVEKAGFAVIEQETGWPAPYRKIKLGKPEPDTGIMRYLEIRNEDDKYYISVW